MPVPQWLDAGHPSGPSLRPDRIKTFTSRMQTGMMVTYWPYGTSTEVHGMADKAMHMVCMAVSSLCLCAVCLCNCVTV